MRKEKAVICCLGIALLLGILACNTARNKVYVKDGKTYGITKGAFRDRWWNYYERGMSFSDGDFLTEAEADLRTSLSQRDEDQRMARTYGMHFIDYFPHRELGVVLYKQKRYAEAREQLERSLSDEESAKAKFYLNETRKAILRNEGRDTAAPVIQILSPVTGQNVNTFFLTLMGEASDDSYVSSLMINNVPEFIELSDRTIRFEKKIPLQPGLNRITITARDLLGNSSEASVTVRADYQGPKLSVLNFSDNQTVNRPDISLELAYADDSGIEYVILGQDKKTTGGTLSGRMAIPLRLAEGENIVTMEALDRAGNRTTGRITLRYQPGTLVAFNDAVASDAFSLAANTPPAGGSGPEISFKGLLKIMEDNEPLTIQARKKNNRFFIEGQVSDTHSISKILVNGEPVSFSAGKTILFNKLVELAEGQNDFSIKAEDEAGKTAERSVKVFRKIQQIDLDESKMVLSVMPFKVTAVSSGIADAVQNLFLQEIINSERFKVVERGPDFEAVLKELKLSQTDLVDKDLAVKTGKLLASEAIVMGSLVENETEIEIYAKLVNVETSEYITIHDVYGQDKSRGNLEYLLAGLASEIIYSVPLIEGQVLAVKGDQFYLDIGRDRHFNVKQGLKCIIYRSEPFIVDGVELGEETSILGTVVLDQVKSKFSIAALSQADIKKGGAGDIKKADKVVTK